MAERCVNNPTFGRVCIDPDRLPRPFLPKWPNVKGLVIAAALAYALVRLDGGKCRGR